MTRHNRIDSPGEELEKDRRTERRLLWKALVALLIVVVFAIVRQRYLL